MRSEKKKKSKTTTHGKAALKKNEETEVKKTKWSSDQFSRAEVEEDPLGVLTVMTTFHQSQQQFGSVVLGGRGKQVKCVLRGFCLWHDLLRTDLQLQNHLHSVFTQWADVVQDQRRDNVDAVGLVGNDARLKKKKQNNTEVVETQMWNVFLSPSIDVMYLVLLTRALTVLCEGLQGLDDEVDIWFVDVEAQQTQTSSGAPAHDVQELQSLTHQVVVGLVILTA